MKDNVKNILLIYGTGGLGDLLISTPLFKDFAEQHPDKKLHFYFKYPFIKDRYIQVFDNNPYFNLADPTKTYFEVVDFNWSDSTNQLEQKRYFDKNIKYIDNIYDVFNKKCSAKVKRTMSYVDIYLSDTEKQEIQEMLKAKNRPVCLVNVGYHPIYTTCRNWGWENFQHVINALKDKIDFIQFGDTKHGFFHRRLRNCKDMLDKTNIRELIKLVNYSDFMLSNDSSPYHFASMNSPYCKRTVVTVLGGKSCYGWLQCYNPTNVEYELVYNNDKYGNCYDEGKYCCDIGNTYMTAYGFASVGDAKLCKRPICNSTGQIVAHCFASITPNEVIRKIEKHL